MAQSIGATPLAVLAGSALIAVAVYFGLRARPVETALTTPTSAAIPTAASPASTGAPAAPAVGSPVPAAGAQGILVAAAGATAPSASGVEADVLTALEKQRAALVDLCWKPLTKGQASPTPAAYVIDVSFDEAGNEVARGLSAKRGATNELTRCLSVRAPSLSIPARGTRARARVPFTLP